jgi:hypothetical protein
MHRQTGMMVIVHLTSEDTICSSQTDSPFSSDGQQFIETSPLAETNFLRITSPIYAVSPEQ